MRSAAIALVFGEDDGYISRWSFRAHQVSLRRLSGCDRSFQVPQTCTTDAFVQCFPDEADHVGSWAAFFFWELIKSTRSHARLVTMGVFFTSLCINVFVWIQ